MQFEKGYIFHIFNQGNNRQPIFLNRENYLFFLKKIRTYILPYADILAWCLMPNHFHLLALVNHMEITLNANDSDGVTLSHAVTKTRSFNDSIGIMLRSYTRAFNKQHKHTGKLIREKTKAECVNYPQELSPSYYLQNGIVTINNYPEEWEYTETCFHYIHQNPVYAGLVKNATDWEFSSAKDYADLRKGSLVNKEIAKKYITRLTI